MPISTHPTPNPNALKFTVGVDVGGPQTYAAGATVEDPTVQSLLELDGVTSVFMTADFVTISKTPDAEWDILAPEASRILAEKYGD